MGNLAHCSFLEQLKMKIKLLLTWISWTLHQMSTSECKPESSSRKSLYLLNNKRQNDPNFFKKGNMYSKEHLNTRSNFRELSRESTEVENSKDISVCSKGQQVCLETHVVRLCSLAKCKKVCFTWTGLDYSLQFQLLKTRNGTRLRKGVAKGRSCVSTASPPNPQGRRLPPGGIG